MRKCYKELSQMKKDTKLKELWVKPHFKLHPKFSISGCNLDFSGIMSSDKEVKFMGCFA